MLLIWRGRRGCTGDFKIPPGFEEKRFGKGLEQGFFYLSENPSGSRTSRKNLGFSRYVRVRRTRNSRKNGSFSVFGRLQPAPPDVHFSNA
jgi:hypothetical protein